MSTSTQSPLKVTVSRDRLRAEVRLTGACSENFPLDLLKTRLNELAIPVTEEVAARIDKLVAAVQNGKRPGDPVLLAEGQAPVPGQPATFKLHTDDKDQDAGDSDNSSFDNRKCKIRTVKAGEVVGEHIPAVPSQPGVDVHGQPIKPDKPPCDFGLGDNVKLADDGKTVIATCDGKVQVTRYSVSVVQTVEISGDVDYSSGNVDVPTDVLIKGTVRSGFKVRSPKSVTVRGAVEGAEVEAGTDITIGGGIAGGGSGKIRAGGELQAKFAGDANIEAAGDVIIAKEALNSRLSTRGRLLVSRGSIIGGSIWAREGLEAQSIGNEIGIRTEIAVGPPPSLVAEVAELSHQIRKKKDTAAKIRQKVQPLMMHLKRLNPEQREKATELMFEADGMDAEAAEMEKRKQEKTAPCTPPPGAEVAVKILKMLHPGCLLIFGDKLATITKARRGPIKIVSREVDHVEVIVCVDQLSGATQILPSQPYQPASAESDEESPSAKAAARPLQPT